ncbi:hypothetical protein M422DRAFT_42119 [Sphaerobolus stellatus SS14]|nr:hypothetical protein M422DRAFT_42119 [Sphaerobolus stellatus SS14]
MHYYSCGFMHYMLGVIVILTFSRPVIDKYSVADIWVTSFSALVFITELGVSLFSLIKRAATIHESSPHGTLCVGFDDLGTSIDTSSKIQFQHFTTYFYPY